MNNTNQKTGVASDVSAAIFDRASAAAQRLREVNMHGGSLDFHECSTAIDAAVAEAGRLKDEAIAWKVCNERTSDAAHDLNNELKLAKAEVERLKRTETSNNEWLKKTEWVQDGAEPRELGMHRADVLKQRIERLRNRVAELEQDLQTTSDALGHASREQEQAEPVGLVQAWSEGYGAGVQDERISESNIGIAGFGAKVNPARQNPYATAKFKHDREQPVKNVVIREGNPTLLSERDIRPTDLRIYTESQGQANLLRQAMEALKWYVEEDDVIEGMAGNEFWVDGKNRALSAIGAIRTHLGDSSDLADEVQVEVETVRSNAPRG